MVLDELLLILLVVIVIFVTVWSMIGIKENLYPSIYIVGIEPINSIDQSKIWALYYTVNGYSQDIYFDTEELLNKYIDYLNKLSGNKLEGK